MKKKLYIVFFIAVISALSAGAATDIIRNGSYIINMGVVPQTINNGLKPYGLVYDLLKNYKVPVRWVINSGKVKDGIDFTNNGINYRGGTFIIPAEFRTPPVNTVIASWEAKGVVGASSVGEFIISDFIILRFAPQWTLDKDNGSIAAAYFVNAGIPASAHGGSSSSGWKTPAQLGECDDIFAMPHADPTWATHQNLLNWNKNHKGNLWAACHAVSVLENLTGPGGETMNFLSSTGLLLYGLHGDGSPPYSYSYPSDPVMQFMGIMDDATDNGSERIFLPRAGGGWRAGAKAVVYDPTQTNVPSLSPGPAAAVVYGRGFDDPARGWVMYEGGHDHNKGKVSDRIAAQRAFFNFSFFSSSGKTAWFDITMNGVNPTIVPGQTIPLSFNVPAGVDVSKYTIQWSSSAGGVFSPAANQQYVNYTPPNATPVEYVSITLTLTDACDRAVFSSSGTFAGPILSSSPVGLSGTVHDDQQIIKLKWNLPPDSPVAGFEVEKSIANSPFSFVTYVPAEQAKTNYAYADHFTGLPSRSYYRIKVIYKNGSVKYSQVITLLSEGDWKNQLKIVSNPVQNGLLAFDFSSLEETKIDWVLLDVMGNRVMSRTSKVSRGTTRLSTDISALAPGLYFIHARSARHVFMDKFIVGKR